MTLEIEKAPYLYRKLFKLLQEQQKQNEKALYGLKSSELIKIISQKYRISKYEMYVVLKELKNEFYK